MDSNLVVLWLIVRTSCLHIICIYSLSHIPFSSVARYIPCIKEDFPTMRSNTPKPRACQAYPELDMLLCIIIHALFGATKPDFCFLFHLSFFSPKQPFLTGIGAWRGDKLKLFTEGYMRLHKVLIVKWLSFLSR